MIAVLALSLALVQPLAAPPPVPREIAVATLASSPEAEAALEQLLGDLRREGSIRIVRSSADAAGYRSCLTSPGLEAGVVASCMYERLARSEEGGRPLVALAVFDDRYGRRLLGCRGPDGDGGASLRTVDSPNVWLRNNARAAIARCFARASAGAGIARPAPEPGAPIRDLPSRRFASLTIEEAQRTATDVVALAVEEAHQPYAARSGTCTILGEVGSVIRGSAFERGTRLRAHVPCAASGSLTPSRSARMHAFQANRIAIFYIGAGGVLDIAPDALCEAESRGRGLTAVQARNRCDTPVEYRRD
jgi:hypothetical protein